jgi:hypothetical protein
MAPNAPFVSEKQVHANNLQTLQRMDTEIEEVLRAVSHVALYHLDVKKMEWVRLLTPSYTTLSCLHPASS